jgi:hypothetical protein
MQANVGDSDSTEFSQVGESKPTEIQDSEIITVNPDHETLSNGNIIGNPGSSDQSNSVSQDQLKEFLSTVMQAIKESANQTAALVQE